MNPVVYILGAGRIRGFQLCILAHGSMLLGLSNLKMRWGYEAKGEDFNCVHGQAPKECGKHLVLRKGPSPSGRSRATGSAAAHISSSTGASL